LAPEKREVKRRGKEGEKRKNGGKGEGKRRKKLIQ